MYWLTVTDAFTIWLLLWIDYLVDIYRWNYALVAVLNWRGGWRWLMLWPGGWCIVLACWLTLIDALTCLLRVESTCWFLDCFARCNRGLLRFFIKEAREKELHTHYMFKAGWKQPLFCCCCTVKYKNTSSPK